MSQSSCHTFLRLFLVEGACFCLSLIGDGNLCVCMQLTPSFRKISWTIRVQSKKFWSCHKENLQNAHVVFLKISVGSSWIIVNVKLPKNNWLVVKLLTHGQSWAKLYCLQFFWNHRGCQSWAKLYCLQFFLKS